MFGGHEITSEEYERSRFMISIVKKDGDWEEHLCGGSLLTDGMASTAGHCIFPPEEGYELILYAGSSTKLTGQVRKIIKVDPYPGFTDQYKGMDAAVVYLDKPIEMDHELFPAITIDLPSSSMEDKEEATFIGWGANRVRNGQYTFPEKLKLTTYPKINFDSCKKYIENKEKKEVLNPALLCAGFLHKNILEHACTADSGSPLFRYKNGKPELMGIFSWSYTNCVSKRQPNGFTDVDHPKIRKFFEDRVKEYYHNQHQQHFRNETSFP
uniref:Peptidase S1 domain-containing protein n=1 Tax=Panagrolaimus superbus TaxID=310955 RepID=A0A914Z3F1_9BILA